MTTRIQNILIWRDTKKCFLTGDYKNVPVIPSKVYSDLPVINELSSNCNFQTKIAVSPLDTFTACMRLLDLGYNVVGLNLANQFHPGGGVGHGCFSQEEYCFRCSNYHLTLTKSLYPIPDKGCIYSPQVVVIKDRDYQIMKRSYIVPMIACAAIRDPKLISSNGNGNMKYYHDKDRELTKARIRQIFAVAYLHQHDTMVLGAFGAGAFNNPPEIVAEIFNEIMIEFDGKFKLIVYAVRSHKDNNFEVFRKTIHGQNSEDILKQLGD